MVVPSGARQGKTSPGVNSPVRQRCWYSVYIDGHRCLNSTAMPRPMAPAQLHPWASASASSALNRSPVRWEAGPPETRLRRVSVSGGRGR